MRMRWQHQLTLLILLFAFVFWAGCGASKSSGKRTSRTQKHRTTSQNQGSVAERTRKDTLRRQGTWSLTSDKVKSIAPMVRRSARKNKIPEDLIYGIIWVESRFNTRATSPVGARGLMQLMPLTARYLAECIEWRGRVNSFSPKFNVAAGSYYIARLINQFKGDENIALAAYNAGPTKVRRWLKGSGLPKVSIEYATMVQTARSFFGSKMPIRTTPKSTTPTITDDDLDRLGLTILIAGLSDKHFGLEREDDANPFD